MLKHLLTAGLTLACAIATTAQAPRRSADRQADAQRPNVVILYADDAGYADFGFMPHAADDLAPLTPRIDSIASDGLTLTSMYMSGCVCSPSRAGLMTGRYQQRFGFDNNLPPGRQDGVDLNETFLVDRLRTLGYETALIGKWHLGYPAEHHPNRRGFDWFYGLLQGSRPYFPIENPSANRVIQLNGEPTPEEGYVTDRFGDAAVRFLHERDTSKPFFLFVSFTAPHGPLQPKPEHAEQLDHIERRARRNFAGLVMSLDENVGKVLDALDELGLSDNTIVLFTNDNGGQTQIGANNGPLHGRKGSLWEGGVRVPAAIRWPGHITPGTTTDAPVISLDLAPTFIQLAGGTVDADWAFDGVSLTDWLADPADAPADRPLFWRKGGVEGDRAVRVGDWKLVHNRSENAAPALFDLSTDLSEANDVAADHPQVVAELLALLNQWETGLATPRWGPGSSTGR